MGCLAQTAAIALAIARICNNADRPIPRLHARAEIVNRVLAPPLCPLCLVRLHSMPLCGPVTLVARPPRAR